MDTYLQILHGFSVAFQPENLLYVLIGCLLGTAVGVLPGLGPSAGIALMLPITFGLEPTGALIMLCGLYYGAMYGGSTASILINTPGESSSVMTALDGHQMARQGRGGAALAVSAIGSCIAGTIAVVLLSFFAVPFSAFALRIGPAEFFTLLLFSLSAVASLSGKSLARGLFAMVLGLIIATVGIDLQSGMPRFTGGVAELQEGVPFLVASVGLFALSEVLINFERHLKGEAQIQPIRGSLWLTREEWRRSRMPILRGTLLGFAKGLLPGGGATIATVLSYSLERSLSKTPERFGQGMIEGVAGPEAANNAAVGGHLVPLPLGVPSSSSSALLLGAFVMFGIQPGPLLMQSHPQLVWGLVDSMYLGNLVLLLLNLPLVFLFVRLLYIPTGLLLPGIVTVASIGIYAIKSSVFDLYLILGFGILGYALRKIDVPLAPMILALVLGSNLEQSFRQALTISAGDMHVFIASPIALGFLIMTLLSLILSLTMPFWRARRLSAGGQA
ncbi:tripartite tricarboxylate transporter permease [Brenneria tiliae]|uniref:tripartite tricarboxylate transporter permease n=1 Tax=Brenneria tiliae TaxID=2914984 RepID=UPI002014D47D|nr:tripartite tricarboxylate transporter permease [Brenneria tiliae]MCL2896940.1 tripartite tricarboxylate transporter permease [Brenneria tiliae]MCL2901498.1 tripartite tricarboxylate transporter permease [Brenneria tiliae]